MNAGVESLQFKVMGRVIDHVEKWTAQGLPVLAAKMATSHGDVGSLDMGAIDTDASILWAGTEERQMEVIDYLFTMTIKSCSLGDWKLGYADMVSSEDGLSALLELCRKQDKLIPSLPIVVLLNACNSANSSGLNFTRTAHLLTKLAIKCVPESRTKLVCLNCDFTHLINTRCQRWFVLRSLFVSLVALVCLLHLFVSCTCLLVSLVC